MTIITPCKIIPFALKMKRALILLYIEQRHYKNTIIYLNKSEFIEIYKKNNAINQ